MQSGPTAEIFGLVMSERADKGVKTDDGPAGPRWRVRPNQNPNAGPDFLIRRDCGAVVPFPLDGERLFIPNVLTNNTPRTIEAEEQTTPLQENGQPPPS
jgi:hypothetical protein